MTTQKKVVLIVILGVGASLFSFLLCRYFSQKDRNNQHQLTALQQMTNRIGNFHLLRVDFIHHGAPKAWQKLTGNLDAIQYSMKKSSPFTGSEKQTLRSLEKQLSHYEQLLDELQLDWNIEKLRPKKTKINAALGHQKIHLHDLTILMEKAFSYER